LVIGNPRLPPSLKDNFGWHDVPYAEQEANIVAEMLQTEALTGNQATKEAVLKRLSEAECIHFASHVSWKFSAVALTPGEFMDSPPKRNTGDDDHHGDMGSGIDSSALSECLLSPADVLQMKLSAKLVVVSVLEFSSNSVKIC
jgi:CHAT domain-containing protein